MKLTFKAVGLNGLITNLKSFDKSQTDNAKGLVRKYADLIARRTQADAAKDTLFMSENVRTVISPQGLTFQVGWLARDFESRSRSRRFYAHYVELGTATTPAQPALRPAFGYYEPRLRAAMRSMMLRTLKQVGR